jgi:hypothetical protein
MDSPVLADPPAHAHGDHAHAPHPEHAHDHRPTRLQRLGALAGLAAVTGYVYLADPDKGGVYPRCPSKVLLGVDCPMCGGLRGTNAFLHGRFTEALDHNILLPIYLMVAAVLVGMWALPLVGGRERTFRPPRWLGIAAITVMMAFAVVRNLPIDSLHYLASGT